jgi:hypothetical protein
VKLEVEISKQLGDRDERIELLVWKRRNADAEVRGYAIFRIPQVTNVLAMRTEWKARQPRSIEACRANDNIALVLVAILVDESIWRELADGIGEDGGVGSDKCFEIAGSWRGTTTARVEVLGDDLVAESWVIVELALHLLVGELARFGGLLTPLDDELESLIQLVLDLLAVLEIFLRVLR